MKQRKAFEHKIELMDGRVLECYPKEEDPTQAIDNELKLDTSGVFLTIGKKQAQQKQEDIDEQKRIDRKTFLDNIFLFIEHRERILSDSRMLLCPIDFNSGMTFADLSVFKRPTLGVYLQWWSVYGGTWTNEHGQKGLICKLAGSGLTGANCCTVVYEDGSVARKVCIDYFKDRLKTFIRINRAYTKAKERYEYYSLDKVINILKSEEL